MGISCHFLYVKERDILNTVLLLCVETVCMSSPWLSQEIHRPQFTKETLQATCKWKDASTELKWEGEDLKK